MGRASFVVAFLSLLAAGWSAYEAHSARIEARSAIEAARRSADAAEKSNNLVARSQSSYLLPSIQRSGDKAAVILRNVSTNVALNIRSGYFLYSGPLKSVSDISSKISSLELHPQVLALGASGETTVVDSLVAANGTKDLTVSFTVPVVKNAFGPQIEMRTQEVKVATVPVPNTTLVIGLVSFEDGLNVQHSATFCFPLNGTLDDHECSKVNSLQLSKP